MALKKSVTYYKEITELLTATRLATCSKHDSCFWLVRKDKKEDKREFLTKSVGIYLQLVSYKISLKLIVKPLIYSVFSMIT